jgi:hypothetical protein
VLQKLAFRLTRKTFSSANALLRKQTKGGIISSIMQPVFAAVEGEKIFSRHLPFNAFVLFGAGGKRMIARTIRRESPSDICIRLLYKFSNKCHNIACNLTL